MVLAAKSNCLNFKVRGRFLEGRGSRGKSSTNANHGHFFFFFFFFIAVRCFFVLLLIYMFSPSRSPGRRLLRGVERELSML